jgi:hypothetical protein
MIIQDVPFYENTPDNTHCYQASLRMVLEYFEPKSRWTWEKLEEFTNKKPNMWTWPMVGLMNMQKRGYEVMAIDTFNYEQFVKEGIKYIERVYGPEIAKVQDEHADINQGIIESKEFIKTNIHKLRPATIEDVESYINLGHLIIADVNLKKMNNQPGIDNHMLLIYGVEEGFIYMHDPGLPPNKARKESIDNFMKAWAFPTTNDSTIKVFRKV